MATTDVSAWSGVETMRGRAQDGPVVMLNLLKFKPGGEQRYREGYVPVAMPLIQRLGGRVVYAGRLAERAHADDAPDWDVVLLVEYPNRQAFIDMVNDPAYRAAHAHRAEAVERALLRASDPIG